MARSIIIKIVYKRDMLHLSVFPLHSTTGSKLLNLSTCLPLASPSIPVNIIS